jgi:hypothetical protein
MRLIGALPTLIEAGGKLFETAIKFLESKQISKGIPASSVHIENLEFKIEVDACVGEFLSLNDGLCSEVRELQSVIVDYLKRETSRPLNILLLSPPGSGKSFLVKQLAKSIDIKGIPDVVSEEYHVSAMRSLDDLYLVLRRIQSANLSNKVPIIFLDEVDAQVGKEYIFSYMLSPMADGRYFQDGQFHSLGKAVFIFAASSLYYGDEISTASKKTMSYAKFRGMIIDRIKEEAGLSTGVKQERRGWTFSRLIDALRQNGTVPRIDLIEKIGDFLDRVNVYICVPGGNVTLSDNEPRKFIRSVTLNGEDTDLGILSDVTNSIDLESLLLAVILIKNEFKVNCIDVDAAIIISWLLENSSSRREAQSAIFVSQIEHEGIFHLEDLSLYKLSAEITEKVDQMKEDRTSHIERAYIELKLVPQYYVI